MYEVRVVYNGLQIAIVDDDPFILELYGDYLEKQGCTIYKFNNGAEAIQYVSNKDNAIDLLITDIRMARMDGWELLTYIRKELELDELALPVIVMSAVESANLSMEYIRYKANEWITKPIKPLNKLLHKIEIVLGLNAGKGTGHEYINGRSGLQ